MVRPLNLLRVGDRLEVLRHAEIVRALDHGADHDAGAAGLARHLHHGGVADREVGGAAEHGGEGLGVAARGGDVHLQAVLLEDAGMHADIEVDVAEIVHGLAEVDLLQVGGRSWICDAYGKPHRPLRKGGGRAAPRTRASRTCCDILRQCASGRSSWRSCHPLSALRYRHCILYAICVPVDWLNQVERFFALLTDWQFRQGVHRSLASLSDAITGFIDQHNADPKPFRWTNTADDILASIERLRNRIWSE